MQLTDQKFKYLVSSAISSQRVQNIGQHCADVIMKVTIMLLLLLLMMIMMMVVMMMMMMMS
jgi:hypothetical protein